MAKIVQTNLMHPKLISQLSESIIKISVIAYSTAKALKIINEINKFKNVTAYLYYQESNPDLIINLTSSELRSHCQTLNFKQTVKPAEVIKKLTELHIISSQKHTQSHQATKLLLILTTLIAAPLITWLSLLIGCSKLYLTPKQINTRSNCEKMLNFSQYSFYSKNQALVKHVNSLVDRLLTTGVTTLEIEKTYVILDDLEEDLKKIGLRKKDTLLFDMNIVSQVVQQTERLRPILRDLETLATYTHPLKIALLIYDPEQTRPQGGTNQSLILAILDQGHITQSKIYSVESLDQQMRGIPEPPTDFRKYADRFRWSLKEVSWRTAPDEYFDSVSWFLQKQLNFSPDIVVNIQADNFQPSQALNLLFTRQIIIYTSPSLGNLSGLTSNWSGQLDSVPCDTTTTCITHSIFIADTDLSSSGTLISRKTQVTAVIEPRLIKYQVRLSYLSTPQNLVRFILPAGAIIDSESKKLEFEIDQPGDYFLNFHIPIESSGSFRYQLFIPPQPANISPLEILINYSSSLQVISSQYPTIAIPGSLRYNDPVLSEVHLDFRK